MKIQVADIAIEYELDGPEDGIVLMLHHSLATRHTMWEEMTIALAQHNRILRFDARGHGESDAPPGPYHFQQLAEDAVGLMNALGIEKAVHVGLSMGGMVSQYMGIAVPQRVQGLVLVSTTSNMPKEARPVWDQRISDVSAKGMAPQVEETLQRWFTKEFRDSGDALLGEVGQMIADTPVNGYCGWAAAIRDLALTPHLGKITAPTLVMVGAQDPGTPPAMSVEISNMIAGAKLQIIPEASHMLPLQKPDSFLETLIDFAEELEDMV